MHKTAVLLIAAFASNVINPVHAATPSAAPIMLDFSTQNLMTKEPVSFSVTFDQAVSLVEISSQRFDEAKFSPTRISGEFSQPNPSGAGILSKSSFSLDRVTGKFYLDYSLDVNGSHWTAAQKAAVGNRSIIGPVFTGYCVKATPKF